MRASAHQRRASVHQHLAGPCLFGLVPTTDELHERVVDRGSAGDGGCGVVQDCACGGAVERPDDLLGDTNRCVLEHELDRDLAVFVRDGGACLAGLAVLLALALGGVGAVAAGLIAVLAVAGGALVEQGRELQQGGRSGAEDGVPGSTTELAEAAGEVHLERQRA